MCDGSRGGFVVVFFSFVFSIKLDGSGGLFFCSIFSFFLFSIRFDGSGGGWGRLVAAVPCWPHHAPQLRQAVARKNPPAENVELFTTVFNCKIRSTNND